MTLSANSLSIAQRCPRRFLFESDPELSKAKWHPRELFGAIFRQGVYELSSGQPVDKVGLRATIRFRDSARDPGIDATEPYVAAGDYSAALQTSLEAVSRLSLLSLTSGPLIDVGSHKWQISSFVDQSEELHRWAVVEKLDEAFLYKELHSWYVFGDMAALDAPMTLHFLELGSFRDGRLRSPWARAFSHPAVANHFKFQTKSGGSLHGKWGTVWYSEGKQDPKTWVDLMQKDNLNLIHHHQLKSLSQSNIESFKAQIQTEGDRLSNLPSISQLPIYRPACDFPTACPWQDKCYI